MSMLYCQERIHWYCKKRKCDKAIGQKMTVYIICRRMFNVYVRFTQLPKPEHTTAIMSPHSLAPHTSVDKTLTFLFELFHLLINISFTRYTFYADSSNSSTISQ